jgi:hypothetical protein
LFRNRKYQLAWWFFSRPILPFAIQLFILGPLILAPDPAVIVGGYVFALPWLLLLFAILNLPFIVSAFRAFRLDPATKRNHVLEHATILYLEAGSGRRFAGRAAKNGFRVSGRASVREIKVAFEQVCRVVRDDESLAYISPRCGSNVVTALGVAMSLLLLVALGSLMFRPPVLVRATALAAVVLLFAGLRHAIGNAVQRRFFMAVDFSEVSLRGIRPVATGPLDRGPAHFVETIVRPKTRNAV